MLEPRHLLPRPNNQAAIMPHSHSLPTSLIITRFSLQLCESGRTTHFLQAKQLRLVTALLDTVKKTEPVKILWESEIQYRNQLFSKCGRSIWTQVCKGGRRVEFRGTVITRSKWNISPGGQGRTYRKIWDEFLWTCMWKLSPQERVASVISQPSMQWWVGRASKQRDKLDTDQGNSNAKLGPTEDLCTTLHQFWSPQPSKGTVVFFTSTFQYHANVFLG